MSSKHQSYTSIRYFSDLMSDYLDQKEHVKPLYHRFPKLDNFRDQICEKKKEWAPLQNRRKVLRDVLITQYENIEDKEITQLNIELLDKQHTFTVTTGHQLNLFTGPLYFLYKIISTINLCKTLSHKYPECNFVPVYWMATEDHDFEEIQYFNYGDKKVVYNRESYGGVGRLSTDGLEDVLEVFKKLLGKHENAQEVIQLFEKGYLNNSNLASATRVIAHELFKEDGLVILDADDSKLKTLAVPYFKEELISQTSFKEVSHTLNSWPQEYKVQVNPREINLFYLTDSYRKRIIEKDGSYSIDGSNITFTKEEILKELQDHPERFSPNVIMRPLYQEIVLPNICYIGGGGEMAYWLELKQYFNSQQVIFPILLMRNSALLITSKQLEKVSKLKLEIWDLFKKDHELTTLLTKKISDIEIDFSTQKDHLKQQFKDLFTIASLTDKSFENAVKAQEHKQIKGLEHLESRLLKAQKRKLKDHLNRALELKKELFPNDSLQERQTNFSFFYQEYGASFISKIKENLDPLDHRFSVIEL
ncbi:bacillithiol biosynthesis cysteine-adding enzyme BshC [uncultured Nonlabens sp.]|uniref:bacillithiol biosynthesis cysteine-adding enzyme BshC n=1 Tax=uncultured Nonlabens sp. TaxID=859306 RepID=UPI002624D8FB|nr:bacillithiol biosynthesis cysteine-adding enzyme BshC [uncultured Nonlabens sp.]